MHGAVDLGDDGLLARVTGLEQLDRGLLFADVLAFDDVLEDDLP